MLKREILKTIDKGGNMTRRYSAETNEDFLKLLNRWIAIEKATIKMTDNLLPKVENPILTCLIDTIKRDSEKHQQILNMVLEGMEGTVTLTHDDMAILGEFIEKHTQIEQDAVNIAGQTIKKVRTPIAKFLLEYLYEDEKKHDFIMDNLSKLKGTAMLPS